MKCRILVVEDSATQAEALRSLLEEERHTVTVARSAEAALECVATETFDLVLSDVVMGGMSGYDLCRQLKQDPLLPDMPVVLLTSLMDPMDIVRGLECGADNYITKPYDPEHLLARVRHVLDTRRLRRNAKTSLGVSVRFLGKELSINSEREQILDLFISSVEDVVRTNEALQRRERELAEAHARLEVYAREQAREARISGERYRALLQNAGDAVLVLDTNGEILETNNRAADLLGRTAESLTGASLADFIGLESEESMRALLARLPEERHVSLGHRRFVDGEGKETWCELTASLTPLAGESLVLLIGRDVTERRRAEGALQETNQLLEALIRAAPLGIVVTEPDLGVRLWNPAAEEIFGFKEAEVIGRRIPIVPADREEECAAVCERLLSNETITSMEMQRLRSDGTLVDVSLSAAPLQDASGRIEGFVGLFADITETKRAEQSLREREEAEQANRAKSEFLSRISHELRTPLNAILGFAQLLQMDDLDQEQQESVEQILRGGRHLLDLINEVLDLSRIEAGKLFLSLEPLPVSQQIGEALSLIRPLATQREITIDTQGVDAGAGFVQADAQRLRQVVLNFLSNAVKYNRPGGAIVLSAERKGEWIRIAVRDTGRGLTSGEIERLFTPFERLDAEHGGIEGSGLGLILAKGLAEAMGGRVGVESTPGDGSTFWVELPTAGEPQPAPGSALPPLPPQRSPDRRSELKHTVLYIEDNPPNLRLVERVLAGRPQIRLLTTMQGRLGLELAREHHPDLVFLDVNLPDLSGAEILRHLRENPLLEEIPVVMISADAMPAQIERFLRAGASAYLTKPIDVKRLLQLVDENLEKSRA